MKTHARVVVIGGGVVGCSVLYHLTKLGWKDVVLCERKELTAGSSWHAAGGFHALNSDPGVARLQAYTIDLYREIEALSGQDVGLHFTGGLNVAASDERWEFLRADAARHRVLGLSTELISPQQVRDLCPLIDVTDVRGALFDPKEGHLDPSGATHAFAKAAVLQGAQIYRHTRVLELIPLASGDWQVVTDKGVITAEHVVNAGGLWAREVGHMAGVQLPVVAMEHHYLITDDIPDLVRAAREIPLVLDLDGEIYMRQERKGVLLGVYEKDATPWAVDGTPWTYGETELLPPNLDRLESSLAKGFARFPALSEVGITRIVNGPFTFTPDGNPLVGPVPGLRNYWAACGVMAGFAQGGGVGLALSQWMIEGEPQDEIYAMDVARFGPYATRQYTIARAREFYARRFQIAYPNEYWPAGRPAKTSPIHGRLTDEGAVYGVSFGLEVPLYFSRAADTATETPTLRRSNAFAEVKTECEITRSGVGILDISSFGKYIVQGVGAEAALNRVLAGRLPAKGRVRLTPMLSQAGRLMGDLTAMRLDDQRFMVGGSGYLQNWHGRWFADHMAGPDVAIINASDSLGGIALVGPRSRELLSRIATVDVSDAALPFMSVREIDLALAPAIVARLSVTGELGYEIYAPVAHVPAIWDALMRAAHGIPTRQIGMYAINSLRLEKGYGIWSREFSRDYTPRMSGLDRFIDYDRAGFIGRDAALRDRGSVPARRLVTLAIEAKDADATGYEPVHHGGKLVGFVTSGGYGHCAGISLAMGYIDFAVAAEQEELAVTIVGEARGCRILCHPAIDPEGMRLRA
jgi:dimethylglycine dehydrogenase